MENNPEVSPKPTRKRSKKAGSDPVGDLQGALEVIPKDIIDPDAEAIIVLEGKSNYKRSTKERIAQWIEIRATDPEITNVEICKRMGIAKNNLYRHIRIAVAEGWLKFTDPMERMEHHIVPKVLKNLERFLDEGDRTVTIEAAKGTIFNTYKERNSTQAPQATILALKIETTTPDNIKITTGTILGRPKQFDEGEITLDEPQS